MKRNLLLLAFALCSLTAPVRAATVALDFSSPVGVGSSFDVVVKVTDVFAGRSSSDALVAFGFNVTVGDPAVVSLVSGEAGPLFDDFSGLFPGTDISGLVSFATNFVLTSADFSEPLTLATLHFKANSAGATTIGVTSDPSDLNQGLVYLDLPYGGISASRPVSVVGAVPEPRVLPVLALGLAALYAAYARRHS